MPELSPAGASLRRPGHVTLGLMTPSQNTPGGMADPSLAMDHARLAEHHGLTGLWVRDVPLAIPQGPDAQSTFLDDPFLWLTALATATETIVLGTAAVVLPLRHPLHVAKSTLTLDRISHGRFALGVATGDRPDEFAPFGASLDDRRDEFRWRWDLLRSALSPDPATRHHLHDVTGGHDLAAPPRSPILQLAVGSAKQPLQWIARNADGWATYYRPLAQQTERFAMWHQAVEKHAHRRPMLIQSMSLHLLEDRAAPAQEISLGVRAGCEALVEHLHAYRGIGVDHVIVGAERSGRPAPEVIAQLGEEVLPHL